MKTQILFKNWLTLELEKVSDWLVANQLTLNIAKSNYIIFGGHKASNFNISVSDQVLHRVNEAKYLGVIIDHKLLWDSKIET